MIKDRIPVTMYEVQELVSNIKETDKIKEILGYIKKFSNTDVKKGLKIKEELTKLDIIKLKESDIIKISDIAPENATELNKIATEANLDSDETNKILETIKQNL